MRVCSVFVSASYTALRGSCFRFGSFCFLLPVFSSVSSLYFSTLYSSLLLLICNIINLSVLLMFLLSLFRYNLSNANNETISGAAVIDVAYWSVCWIATPAA